MKIQYILLCILLLSCCCLSQSILNLKTGEIHIGEYYKSDSVKVQFQFYGIDAPQNIPIEQIEKLILSDRRVLIKNGIYPDSNDIFISWAEQMDLISNSTPYLIPIFKNKDDNIVYYSVKNVTLLDKYDILVTINGVIWVGELVQIHSYDIEFRPFDSNVNQRIKNSVVKHLVVPAPEDFYADIDVAQFESNSISYQEYRAMIQKVVDIEGKQSQTTETPTIKHNDLFLREVPAVSFPGAKKVYTISDKKGYKFKHVELVSLDNNILYFRHPQKILDKKNSRIITREVSQIKSIKPISKKINLTLIGAVGGTAIGVIAGMTDPYFGGPVLAVLVGFVYGTLGTGIGLIIDIPFWIYDETHKVNLIKLGQSERIDVIEKFINSGGKP